MAYALRVSVIERCQFRCPYCLPGSTAPFLPKSAWLSIADYERLACAMSATPLAKIRFTGGEPLLRPDLPEIAALWRRYFPAASLALTTNAQLLSLAKMDQLRATGIEKINLHLDTLDPVRYLRIMGKGNPQALIAMLSEAKARFDEVKINMVVQKGVNDHELEDFLGLSERSGVQVRFIELMNTGSAKAYVQKSFLSGADIVGKIAKARSVRRLERRESSDPASLWQCESGTVFGVIASDTQPFCDACNRLRLTVDGRLRGCLYESGGVDLGAALKQGVPDAALGQLIRQGVSQKRSFHPVSHSDNPGFSMAQIGG